MRIKLLQAFATTLLLVGCGESAPVKTTLSALSEVQKDFDGRLVMVSGTLRTFDMPRHYWIENDALDRVALEGAINFAPLDSQTVTVRGMFRYDREAGRRLFIVCLLYGETYDKSCLNHFELQAAGRSYVRQ